MFVKLFIWLDWKQTCMSHVAIETMPEVFVDQSSKDVYERNF